MAVQRVMRHCALAVTLLWLCLSTLSQAAAPQSSVRQHHYDSISDYHDQQYAAHNPSYQHLHSNSGLRDPNGNPAQHAPDLSKAHGRVPVLTILAMTTFMSAMAGFGAVPFFFCGKLQHRWAGIANAVACGVMLAASFDLLHEGAPYSPTLTIAGMILGAVFIKSSQEYLSKYEDAAFEELSGADARKAMLIVGVMAAHAFGEGSGVGVSFSGQRGWAQGTLVTIAIGLHNIPEGMAVATVMVSKGAKPTKALFWSLFCAFPQALVAVPSYLFVETFQSLLPLALGFAAGCMIWILTAELMPDALEAAPHPLVATCTTLSAAWLQGLSMMIATLEKPDGALSSPFKADAGSLITSTVCLVLCLAPMVAAAAVAAGAIPAMQVALGATAGVLGALGASCLLWLVWAGELSVLHTLLWAACGAVGSMAVWKTVFQPPDPLQVKRSLEGELSAAKSDGAHKGSDSHAVNVSRGPWSDVSNAYLRSNSSATAPPAALAVALTKPGQWQPEQPSAQVHVNGYATANGQHAWGADSNHAAPYVNGSSMEVYGNGHGTHAGQWPQNGTAFANGFHPQQNGNGAGPFAAYAHMPPFNAGEGGQQAEGAFGHRKGSMGQHHLHAPDPHKQEDEARLQGLGLPLVGGVGQHGMTVRTVLHAATLLCCHAGVSIGLQVAAGLGAHIAEVTAGGGGLVALFGHWLVPLLLQGVPVGLACVGIGKGLGALSKLPAILMSVAAAVITVLVMLLGVAGVPLGQAGTYGAHSWDGGWWQAARAAAAGALLAGSISQVWPLAASSKAARAQSGLILGVLVVVGCQLVAAGLCAGTPYCLS